MERRYRVKDVQAKTGLSRKALHEYNLKGVVRPVSFETRAEHKIYDQKGMDKLCTIALLKNLGAQLYEIQELHSDLDFAALLKILDKRAKSDMAISNDRLEIMRHMMTSGNNPKWYSSKSTNVNELATILKGGNDK